MVYLFVISFIDSSYFKKVGKYYIYTKKTMLILNMFIYKLFYVKKMNLQDIIVVQMYEIMKIQIHF